MNWSDGFSFLLIILLLLMGFLQINITNNSDYSPWTQDVILGSFTVDYCPNGAYSGFRYNIEPVAEGSWFDSGKVSRVSWV